MLPMTPDEQNNSIAQACGVKPFIYGWAAHHPTEDSMCLSADTKLEVEEWLARLPADSWCKNYVAKPLTRIPLYTTCLNACHEMEKVLIGPQAILYERMLENMVRAQARTQPGDRYPRAATICSWHATAAQRAEAFLRTIGKWKGKP